MWYKDFARTILLKQPGGGFTLIELMVVIAITGTLAGISIPLYANYIEKARVTRAIAEIGILENEIWLYHDENDALPTALDDIGRGDLNDPWGNPYQYLNLGTVGKGGGGKGGGGPQKGKPRKDRFLVPINTDYDLYSMGRDGRSVAPLTAQMSRDDIVRANDGEFIGLAYKY